MKKDKVILAYSGGLDTSVILKWLVEKNYEVIAYIADVGQQEGFELIKAKALAVGASSVHIADLKKEFVTDYIFPVIKAGVVYEGKYLLGTSIARPLIAKKQIEIANKENAKFVAHGATGKGNDQVRFELAYFALNPNIQVIAPWRDSEFLQSFQGRTDMLNYAKKHNIPVTATIAKSYSEDANLFHVSHEAGNLEDLDFEADEGVYTITNSPESAPDVVTKISVTFECGVPVKVENHNDATVKTDPLEIFTYLNQLGCENGIGRLDMVENRFIGVKSRGVYETPGGTILHAAHQDLETIVIDKEVMRIKDMLSAKMADSIYNGFWFSPEMDFMMSAIDKSQEKASGVVTLKLYKGNVYPVTRNSKCSLYNKGVVSMDSIGSYDPHDAEGFIHTQALRLIKYSKVHKNGQ